MFWKIYFWFVVTILALAYVFDGGWTAVDHISNLFLLFAMTGMYGYAYSKMVWNQKAWQFIAPLVTVYWYFYVFYLDPRYGAHPAGSTAEYVIEFLAPLPIFIACLLYAYSGKVFEQEAKRLP